MKEMPKYLVVLMLLLAFLLVVIGIWRMLGLGIEGLSGAKILEAAWNSIGDFISDTGLSDISDAAI